MRGQVEVMRVMMKSGVTDMHEMDNPHPALPEENRRKKPGPEAEPGNLSEDQCGVYLSTLIPPP